MEEIKIDEMTSVIDGVHDIVENTHFEAPQLDTSVSSKSSIGYMAIGAAAVGAGAAAWHFGKKAFKSIKQKLKDKKEAKEVTDNEDNFDDDNKSDKE